MCFTSQQSWKKFVWACQALPRVGFGTSWYPPTNEETPRFGRPRIAKTRSQGGAIWQGFFCNFWLAWLLIGYQKKRKNGSSFGTKKYASGRAFIMCFVPGGSSLGTKFLPPQSRFFFPKSGKSAAKNHGFFAGMLWHLGVWDLLFFHSPCVF